MHEAHHRLLLLPLWVLSGCVDNDADLMCEQWKSEARSYQACYPLAYPPVVDDGDVSCVTEVGFVNSSEDIELFSDIGTISDCVDYLRQKNSPCDFLKSDPGRSWPQTIQRISHCTFGVVKHWTPPTGGDPCKRWKDAASYFSQCDPAIFPVLADSVRCVDDHEVAVRTKGRFSTLGECADYVYSMAFPCTVALGDDRELCSNLMIEEDQ